MYDGGLLMKKLNVIGFLASFIIILLILYFHPTVLTKKGERMSKSLGTGIDPLEIIEDYGADALRFSLLWQTTQDRQDIRFGKEDVIMAQKFETKIWNATRFILLQMEQIGLEQVTLPSAKGKAKILQQVEDLAQKVDQNIEKFVFNKIKIALINKDGLCAKWMPRKGLMAVKLRNALDMTPKQYRKTLVRLSDTVEQKMCAKQWNSIDFNKVPSLAHSRYRSAFMRNAEANFNRYMEKVKKGEAKINAGAVYPYDVVKNINMYMLKTERDHIVAQWNALEDFVGDAKVFPMIDVSGSMYSNVGKNLTCMGIAVSLGLYFADKNKGAFKDCFLTFSENPEIQYVRGDIVKKYNQVKESDWGFNTNLHRAFDAILHLAVSKNVPEKHMPETLIIFSDMQFDQCVEFDDTAFEMIKRKYSKAGYNMPNVVFWNINAYDNVPVKFNESGVALVSGFSPSVAKAILHGNLDELTPENVMLKTVMVPRYDL